MTDKEKYDFIDRVVHLTLFEEDRLLNEHGGDYSGLEEDGIDSNEYYRIITERVINTLKKNNNYMQEEPVSENLEEAANDFAEGEWDGLHDNDGNALYDQDYVEYAFKAGAEWQKEQMMAKAIDGDITFDYYGNDDKTYGCIAHDSFCLEDMGLKDRDKVKIVVIK